jgi:hypothetical protein
MPVRNKERHRIGRIGWLRAGVLGANPVASAITTKKVNVPKRLASVLLNHVTSPKKTRKIEVRHDPEQLSGWTSRSSEQECSLSLGSRGWGD